MIKWIKYLKRIPIKVQVSKSRIFEVLWTDNFEGGKTLGETRFNKDQIIIKRNEPIKEMVHTYVHEVLHAFSEEYGANLTEKQVLALEKALYYVVKNGNIFLGANKSGKK